RAARRVAFLERSPLAKTGSGLAGSSCTVGRFSSGDAARTGLPSGPVRRDGVSATSVADYPADSLRKGAPIQVGCGSGRWEAVCPRGRACAGCQSRSDQGAMPQGCRARRLLGRLFRRTQDQAEVAPAGGHSSDVEELMAYSLWLMARGQGPMAYSRLLTVRHRGSTRMAGVSEFSLSSC